MEGSAWTCFTPKQKAKLWERWRRGQCVVDIARALERRNKSGVYRVLALNGGIAPAPRRRGPLFAVYLRDTAVHGPIRLPMVQYLHFLTDTTTLFGFDFQNWMLAAAAIIMVWVLVLIQGAK